MKIFQHWLSRLVEFEEQAAASRGHHLILCLGQYASIRRLLRAAASALLLRETPLALSSNTSVVIAVFLQILHTNNMPCMVHVTEYHS
jgi:hypothetical protein